MRFPINFISHPQREILDRKYNIAMEDLTRHLPALDPPLLNAAGTLGFAPDPRAPVPWDAFGAFVTNPISARARQPAAQHRWHTYPGGALLHTGHPNPGLGQVVRRFSARWAQAPLPVVIHLLAASPEVIQKQVMRLETIENILAVEIGFPDNIGGAETGEVLSAAFGELPVVARLPLVRVLELATAAEDAGVSAISLGPPRGALPTGEDIATGRMYGPGLYPLCLQVVRELAGMALPVIAGGGIFIQRQVEETIQAGAAAVQVDLALWRGDWLTAEGAS